MKIINYKKFWYTYILTLSKSISFMIMCVISIYVLGQSSNYTWKIGIMIIIPMTFVSFHYFFANIIKLIKMVKKNDE